MDPWDVELVVVQHGSLDGGERRALSREVTAGRFLVVRPQVYVPSPAQPLDRRAWQVLKIRALAAVSAEPPVFSHWSAMLLHGMDPYRVRLGEVHVTVGPKAFRGRQGVRAHLLALDGTETTEVHGLRVTDVARTVVDVVGAAGGGEGLAAADAALCEGLPRYRLEAAVDLAGRRRGMGRTLDVIAFAHPGGESAAESEFRRTAFRLGLAPMVLQHTFRDVQGFIGRVDAVDADVQRVCEIDGAKKYLDPELTEERAKRIVFEEKVREDRIRALTSGFARFGFGVARNAQQLQPVLARIGILPAASRPSLADWAAVAAAASPSRRGRFAPRPAFSWTPTR